MELLEAKNPCKDWIAHIWENINFEEHPKDSKENIRVFECQGDLQQLIMK
jgi:hypothetical protein